MKTQLTTLSLLTTLLLSGSTLFAQNITPENVKEYQVETRLENYTRPITFTPTKAVSLNGAITENIVTTTQNILNKEAHFLKKGVVKVVGEEQFSPWEMVSDEGGAAHHQTAPNPLTYYAVGSASSLLTQVERAIEVLGLNVDDVKVESKIFFRWSDPMSDTWSGYTDKVISNILIKSNESAEKIKALRDMALNAWAVGEGLANKSSIDVNILVNSDEWAGLNPSAGNVPTPISKDNGRLLTNVTPDLKLQTMEVEKDLEVEMGNFPNPFIFTEIAIAESGNDVTRPYMHKIRAKSLTQNYETWELYADDSREYVGIDKAPTSRSYFTVGTSFCLMSQLTANKMYFHKKGIEISDFRVEHQFDFVQENFMTPSMQGRLDSVTTNVIVNTQAGKELANSYAMQALKMCFAGEGIQNETQMESNIFLNGKIVK